MPDLRIQTNIDNGDLPEQLELFEDLEPRDKPLEEFDELFKSIFGKEKNKQFSYAPSYEKTPCDNMSQGVDFLFIIL